MKHWHETRAVLHRLAELRGAGRRAALATVVRARGSAYRHEGAKLLVAEDGSTVGNVDRKSTRLNSSHGYISYAVFCLKKKKKTKESPVPEYDRSTLGYSHQREDA